MAADQMRSPVVVDGIVSGEKLSQLLGLEAEYPELDFKSQIDPANRVGEVNLAKHVGAMRVRGGYIVLGVDGSGTPTGEMDDVDLRSFDEANLAPKLLRYLEDVGVRVQVFELNGHKIVLLCVLPSPTGCTFFKADGKYTPENGREVVVFRQGDVFWRDGTRSVRMTRAGLENVIEARVGKAKDDWLQEQHSIRRRESELDEVGPAQAVGGPSSADEGDGGRPPLDRLDLDLPPGELGSLALELARDGDEIGLGYLLNDAVARARAQIEGGDVESGLVDLLDRLTCLAALLLRHDVTGWFERVVDTMAKIYSLGFGPGDARRLGYSTSIGRQEIGPRVWLAVIEHVYALGGLSVRLEHWDAVRILTLQLPRPLAEEGYDKNWLRHALTMAARADHLREEKDTGGTVDISLLSLARKVTERLDCLRPDGLDAGDDSIFTDLAQFDLLSNLVAIDDVGEPQGRVFYPNFARFRQERIQPIADRVVDDPELRSALFRGGDEILARALVEVGARAANEGWQFDGFMGWERTPVAAFILEQLEERA
jgi:hypothetical protein